MKKLRKIAIVAGHFPPGNLTAVHRSRLWAQHLSEFGWEPVIVTAHWKYYEEELDWALLELVSPQLRVIRTKAFPVRPVRLIGDIGTRALYWHFKALDELIVRKEIDFLHITIPSNMSAVLGELLYRRHRFPFGIDYIDPWLHVWPGAEKPFSKAWLACHLTNWAEPWAVKNASLITGVAPGYFEPMLDRNPKLRDRCVTAAMPYGNSVADYCLIGSKRETFLFPSNDGLFHVIYAGAMLPKAYTVLERFLESLVALRERSPEIIERLRIHFVGTGKSPNDPQGYNIRPYVQRLELDRWVDEHPNRIGYVDVLNHCAHASAILVIGSTEAHYTPSKVYQAVQAKRPIFALLHEESTAVRILRECRVGTTVTFSSNRLPEIQELAASLARFLENPEYSADLVQWDCFEKYSARASAQILANAVESALELFKSRNLMHVQEPD